MIEFLRRVTDHWITKVILGIVALIFILFFGSSTQFGDRTQSVATVNGIAIRDRDLMDLVRRQVRMEQRFRKNMTDADRQRIENQALDALIDRQVMLQEAHRQGFVVSDAELRDSIMSEAAFQGEDGKFSKAKYDEMIGKRGTARFEREQREMLLISAMEDFVRRSVQVSEPELQAAFAEDAAKRDIEFLRVNNSLFRDGVVLADEEVAAWLTAHEGEVKARYERDFDRVYNQPKKVHGRHILMKFEEADDETARAEVRRRMEAVLTETRAPGADFEALARRYSEDSSATRGGDLGFFDEKRMVEEFSRAAFAMTPGQISEIVETKYGLHIIQVLEVQEPKTQTFDEVKNDITRELLLDEKTPALAQAYAVRLKAALDGSLPEEEVAALLAEKSVAKEETGEFSRGDRRVPRVGGGPEVLAAAFSLQKVGDITAEPVKTNTGWVVMKLRSRTDADPTAYEAGKADLRQRTLMARQQRALDGWKASLKAKASIQIQRGV
jgi:peptidyl-prolyl cis-trans isomerase D